MKTGASFCLFVTDRKSLPYRVNIVPGSHNTNSGKIVHITNTATCAMMKGILDLASAKAWFDEERIAWITERYSPPSLRYFETPVIVDKVAGRVDNPGW